MQICLFLQWILHFFGFFGFFLYKKSQKIQKTNAIIIVKTNIFAYFFGFFVFFGFLGRKSLRLSPRLTQSAGRHVHLHVTFLVIVLNSIGLDHLKRCITKNISAWISHTCIKIDVHSSKYSEEYTHNSLWISCLLHKCLRDIW